jgi:hypothetical protein
MFWKRTFITLSLGSALWAGGPAAAGDLSGNCRVADQPAATLLIPYFEVDLGRSGGANTLFSVNNASSKPAVARVVLWTDWGIPTLAFDIYLTGYDVQTFNVRDLFGGALPATGPDVSPLGALSGSGVLFEGCGGVGRGSVAASSTALDLAFLRAAHSGRPVSTGVKSQCAGSAGVDPNLATGYITVDAVHRCSPTTIGTLVNTPAHATYFGAGGTGLASDANVLWGDYYSVNPERGKADSQTAVAIVADADLFNPGDYTFYGRYTGFDSRDDRAPLSSLYYVRYVDGGTFSGGTDLVVWRDNRKTGVETHDCGTQPGWAPLGEEQLVVFDEEENPRDVPNSNAFPLATQKVHVGGPSLPVSQPFGFLMLDLWHRDSTHAQGWVSVSMSAEGRFSTGHEAVRVDDMCNFGP